MASFRIALALVALELMPVAVVRAETAPPHKSVALATQQGSDALRQAEAAVAAGQFARARDLAMSVSAEHPQAARAKFVEGYSRYKLGQLEEAMKAIQVALIKEQQPEIVFLAGLVAFELRRWSEVERLLKPLVSANQPPWTEPAAKLLGKAQFQAASERQRNNLAVHTEALHRAKELLSARRFAEARQALGEADRASPGKALTHYYLGYLAYENGDYAAAREQFRAALRFDQSDQWSMYMLALTLDESEPERTSLLGRLSQTSDLTLRAAARQAMSTARSTASRGALSLLVELGSGLDTNPGQVTAGTSLASGGTRIDRPVQSEQGVQPTNNAAEAALALRGRLDLSYRRQLSSRQQGTIGIRLFEQGFAAGGSGKEQTEIDALLHYSLRLRRAYLTASYEYAFDMLGHTPLLSLHDFNLGLGVPIRSWLSAVAVTGLRWRHIHDETYQYMQALEWSSSASLRGQWSSATLQGGYMLRRSWASPVEITLDSQSGPHGGATTIYRTNYTFLAHGPQLDLELSLPWRLSFHGAVWILWHAFDVPERFELQSSGSIIWQQSRRDLNIIGIAELRRPLRYGLELALLFSSFDNLSSLDASTPVNRSYSRRSLLGCLRWRWPMP